MRKRLLAVVLCIVSMLILSASSKPSKEFVIYVDDGEADYLVEKKMSGENTVENLMECLMQNQMIPEGTKVKSYEVTKETGKKILNLDLSSQYEEAVLHTGNAGEFMYIYSIVNTMIQNQKVDAVRLTVEGHVIETGHSIYDEPLVFSEYVKKN